MDMEVNLLMGGPDHASPLVAVQDDPVVKTLRGVANARRTLRSGFTTVRNLGLFVQTGGILLDVALKKAIDLGWVDGPRIVPAGHAISPTGGHLDPTMFQKLGPGVLPLTVEEGIADGVAEVRKAVRYQIKYGAELIKVCASGGVMSHTGPAGAQQYSDEELRVVVDEAHRAGLKVAAHAHGDDGIRAAVEAGIDCIEHGSLMSDETMTLMIERGTFLVPTTYLADGMDVSHADPALQKKAAEVFPRAKETVSKAIQRGVEDRLRHRRAGHLPRPQRQGAHRARRPRHDAHPGHPRRDHDGGRAHRRRRPRSARTRAARGRHRASKAIRSRTSPRPSRCDS